MSRRAVADRPRHSSLLFSLGTGPGAATSVTPPTPTFHLLTEGGDTLTTEAGDALDIEHV